jgi:SAM-dependent methyltransferase
MKNFIRRVLRKLLSLIPEDAPPVSPDSQLDAATLDASVLPSQTESQSESIALPGAASQGDIPSSPSMLTPAASVPLSEADSPAEPSASPDAAPPAQPSVSPDAAPIADTAPTTEAAPPPPLNEPVLLRTAFRNYLTGNGLEIGALHNPLDISGLSISSIRYVDRMVEEELLKQYPELEGQPLVHVDVVDDGELLSTIPDGSVDFIIGNHFLEHTRNPIGTLESWLKKLTPHGVLFLAIPDKRFTFDECRPLSALEHIVEDYQCALAERTQRDHQHFWEWATYIYKIPEELSHRHADYLEEINYSIHFHTFTLQSFLGILKYMQDELHIPFELKACADLLAGGNEFLLILSPKTPDTATVPADPALEPETEHAPYDSPPQAPASEDASN